MLDRRKRSGLAGLVAVLSALSAPAMATPGDAAEASALLQRGVDLRRSGRDQDALDLFRRAYQLAPSPRALAQIGLAEQALGQWVDASRDLEEALTHSLDPWIVRNKPTLTSALARVQAHVGHLVVLGSPSGAQVVINGKAAGALPLDAAATVPAGEVVVEVRALGYVSLLRKVMVAAGVLIRETIDLTPVPAAEVSPPPLARASLAPPPQPPPSGAASAEPSPPTAPAVRTSPPEATNRQGRSNVPALVVGGLSLGALAVGTIADIYHVRKADAFNQPGAGCGSEALGRGTGADCQGLYDSVRRSKIVALLGFASAGLLGAVSATLFFIHREPSETAGRQVACGWTGSGASCAVAF